MKGKKVFVQVLVMDRGLLQQFELQEYQVDELLQKIGELVKESIIIDSINEEDKDDSEVEVSEEERCELMKDKELVSDCCGADLKGIVSADGLSKCPECHEGCCAERQKDILEARNFGHTNRVLSKFLDKIKKEVENE